MEKSIWLESCEKMWRQQCHLQYDQLVNNSITKIWIVCTYCIVNDPNSICFIQGVVNYASSLGLGCTHLLVCSSSFLVGQIQIRVRQSLSSDWNVSHHKLRAEHRTPTIEIWPHFLATLKPNWFLHLLFLWVNLIHVFWNSIQPNQYNSIYKSTA